ncbi:MAG: carboxypeptidase-like regulatory domain-containing protein [Planctomycetota bacterium]
MRRSLAPTLLAVSLLAAAAALAWLLASETPATPASQRPTAEQAQAPQPPRDAAPAERTLARLVADATQLRVRGRVVDAYGEPVERALVGDLSARGPSSTAADGRFELIADRPSAALEVLVLAQGFPPLVTTTDPGEGQDLDLGDLQLAHGGRLLGTVVDADGGAIAGARVEVRPLARSAWPAAVDLATLFAPTQTDAGGNFALARLPAGQYQLVASAPGRQTAHVGPRTVRDADDTTTPPIVLATGFALCGRVLGPDDRPIDGARVRLRKLPNGPRIEARAESAADGTFTVEALPPGPLRIEVEREGFLGCTRDDVAPERQEVLVLHLEAGLRIAGAVRDAGTGSPIEVFAVGVQRVAGSRTARSGTAEQQLAQRIASLRDSAARTTDAPARDRSLHLAADLDDRLARIRREAPLQPVSLAGTQDAPVAHAEGRFACEGLQEGTYVVVIAAPGRQSTRSQPIELRRGEATPELVFSLLPGHEVVGAVRSRVDAGPVAGAEVELIAVREHAPAVVNEAEALYPWLFARPGPAGLGIARTRTDAGGQFAFAGLAPGRYAVSLHHPRFADRDSDVFDVQGRRQVQVDMGPRARLQGRVHGIADRQDTIEVLALGGHGTMRKTTVAADGTYRIDDLPPGEYLVRAYPAKATRYVSRMLGAIFPLHAGAASKDRIPPRDVTLAEGEVRTHDLTLDRPATGRVQGTIAIQGQPAAGCRTWLRPVEGEAPGAGGQSVRGDHDQHGRFAIPDVPVGTYTLSVTTRSRQELASQPVTVHDGETVEVQLDLTAGGLRGRVRAQGVANRDELLGALWVLPGATSPPDDLYAYRREHRVHRLSVRGGAFADDALTPGEAVLVLDLRGRKPTSARADIPAGGILELDLDAGDRLP